MTISCHSRLTRAFEQGARTFDRILAPRSSEPLYRHAKEWSISAEPRFMHRWARGFSADILLPASVLRGCFAPKPTGVSQPAPLVGSGASLLGASIRCAARVLASLMLCLTVGVPIALARLLCGYWIWRQAPELIELSSSKQKDALAERLSESLRDQAIADLQKSPQASSHPQFYLDLKRNFRVVVTKNDGKSVSLNRLIQCSEGEILSKDQAESALAHLTDNFSQWQRQVTMLASQKTPIELLSAYAHTPGLWRLGGNVWPADKKPDFVFLSLLFSKCQNVDIDLLRLPTHSEQPAKKIQIKFSMRWSVSDLQKLSSQAKEISQGAADGTVLQLQHRRGCSLEYALAVDRPTSLKPCGISATKVC